MRGSRGTPRRAVPRRGTASFVRAPAPPLPVNGYSVTVTAPVSGFVSRSQRPVISFSATSILNDPVDVQVEWQTSDPSRMGWVAVYTNSLLALGSGSAQTVQPPTNLDYRTWWYRLRSGKLSTNTWGLWTDSSRHVNVQAVLGSTSAYVELNVGVVSPPVLNATAYVDFNIGRGEDTKLSSKTVYSDLNIGLDPRIKVAIAYSDMNVYPFSNVRSFVQYSDLNVVPTKPNPTIWWIRPEQGKEGYVFNIFGHGFGGYKGQYSGVVRIGNLVCDIASWTLVPAAPRTTTVVVTGTASATAPSIGQFPKVLLSPALVTLSAGDTIEYDLRWDTPINSKLDIFPYFYVTNVGPVGVGSIGGPTDLVSEDGKGWVATSIPEAYGAWVHRKFTVPGSSPLVGKVITNFSLAWFSYNPAQPQTSASVRSYVVRDANGLAKLWVTGDDNFSAPPLTYEATSGSTLTSATISQVKHVITHGAALDPDIITPEHGWIVAVVPTGAVSSMVQISLE